MVTQQPGDEHCWVRPPGHCALLNSPPVLLVTVKLNTCPEHKVVDVVLVVVDVVVEVVVEVVVLEVVVVDVVVLVVTVVVVEVDVVVVVLVAVVVVDCVVVVVEPLPGQSPSARGFFIRKAVAVFRLTCAPAPKSTW